MPTRIQRKRAKGWRMPEGAVNCTRPSLFGNPFSVEIVGHEQAIALHRVWLTSPKIARELGYNRETAVLLDALKAQVLAALPELRGKDLGEPAPYERDRCHAATLIELANMPVQAEDTE
jgi:hypothetical protein